MVANEQFIEESIRRDPSWDRAYKIASERLQVPTHVWNLFRNGWNGALDTDEFIRVLGFSRLNPSCVLQAANLSDRNADVESLLQATELIGLRLSVVVLAINFTCTAILRSEPPPTWRPVFEEMMSNIEIGTKLGSRILSLSPAGGALIGFSRGAGLGLLLAHDPTAFVRWYSLTKGLEGRELLMQHFGCEAYQVSACAVQQLGFGPEIAIGAGIATGRLDPRHITIDDQVLKWKAAFHWIEALRQGRGYPGDLKSRSFFPEVTPPADPKGKNTRLEVLYTEVAKVKRHGSSWSWHLPRPGYEETFKALQNGSLFRKAAP